MRSKRRRFRQKAHRNSSLPGRPKTGRPPGVPYTTFRKNPAGLSAMATFVGTGFGGFAVTRATSRIMGTAIAKKWPRAAKHAAALIAVGVAGAAWFWGDRIKALAKYHTPIVAGAGIAAAQTLIQTYVPRYGWLIGSPLEEGGGTTPGQTQQIAAGSDGDSEWFTYNDAMDAGRYADETAALPSAQERGDATPGSDALDDLLAEMDTDGGMGVFN